MPRAHTHYDNLKVARDAPMEVIHAAYRSLAAMYHPDRHPGDEEAARIMQVINNSYLALCDPVRKRDHRLTLYKVLNGNTHFVAIGPEEF